MSLTPEQEIRAANYAEILSQTDPADPAPSATYCPWCPEEPVPVRADGSATCPVHGVLDHVLELDTDDMETP